MQSKLIYQNVKKSDESDIYFLKTWSIWLFWPLCRGRRCLFCTPWGAWWVEQGSFVVGVRGSQEWASTWGVEESSQGERKKARRINEIYQETCLHSTSFLDNEVWAAVQTVNWNYAELGIWSSMSWELVCFFCVLRLDLSWCCVKSVASMWTEVPGL